MKKLPVKNLGQTDSIAVLTQRVDIQDKHVIDVGCGDMVFSKKLCDAGARVLAIDPDPIQSALNREMESLDRLEFLESAAESIPLADDSLDGVCFSFSLHHVPGDTYPAVFNELFRVLRPGGFMYVVEPTSCVLNDVMKRFHDEDKERDAAQDVLHQLAVPRFESAESVTYHSYISYDGWEHFATRFAGKSFNELYSESDIRRPEVKAAFEAVGAPDYTFFSPKLTMLLTGFRGAL